MNEQKYPGAKWWKFDCHTHTPASYDFKKSGNGQEITPETWLQKFMEKNIDCVAITDHNSGEWIDILKGKLNELEQNKPTWYRPIHLFPGVEISVQGGIHMLAIFDKDKSKRDVDALLGAVDYKGRDGYSDGVTKQSLTEVINSIAQAGAIPIPAHVDRKNGLFLKSMGNSLEAVLNSSDIYAMELCDNAYNKPELYSSNKVNWTEIVGSDFHNPQEDNRLGIFTWIKMDEPSIEGLRLALIDGIASVNRNMDYDPNHHAEFIIEEVSVEKAKYIGRSKELNCAFSPFFNAIIGGRGSGKSTLIEFMRLVLRRKGEIPPSLEEDSRKYFETGGQNLLTNESKVSLIYRKGNTRYRLNWSKDENIPSLEEEGNKGWEATMGEIKSLFPVYIYSQKQIFELAKNPQALIKIIDEAPEVDYAKIRNIKQDLEEKYKQSTRKLHEIIKKLEQEERLQGELRDMERQITQIEQPDHKEFLQNYRRREQQLSAITALENGWRDMQQWLKENQDKIVSLMINEDIFATHPSIFDGLKKTNTQWAILSGEFRQFIDKARRIMQEWEEGKDSADWMKELKEEMDQYEQLRTRFEQQEIDPVKYSHLLRKQKEIQRQLENIKNLGEQKERLLTERKELLRRAEQNMTVLTKNRESFLENTLRGNKFISIKILPFREEWNGVEKSIRSILHCPWQFSKDIELLKNYYSNGGKEKIQNLKDSIIAIRDDQARAQDARFAAHLKNLTQETIDNLMLWFPDDKLKITFRRGSKKFYFGSPGQKTAALLAFILSYGNEPLLLDQPEDDLDNELIYDLIVKSLRDSKGKRQIIIVTHNANIVVNGDAEMVLPLIVGDDQTEMPEVASIQKGIIRRRICDILEGGEEAFEERYKRIHLGD